MKKLIIPLLILLSTVISKGADYYFSNSGNDANKGTSLDSPWKSIDKMNELTLKPGDNLYLKAGDVFRGTIIIKHSGKKDKPIQLTSYGNGSKPIVSGAVKVRGLMPYDYNILTTRMEQKVHAVYIDDRYANIAKHPNIGFSTISTGNKTSLTDPELSGLDFDLTGAGVRIKSVDWQFETMEISKHENSTIHFKEPLIYTSNKGYGYILDNKYEFMDIDGEWYYNEASKSFYIYTDQKVVSNDRIEAGVFENGIVITENTSNISISNLEIVKYSNASVFLNNGVKNVEINHCKIKNSIVYGVNVLQGSDYITIRDCQIYDIPGRGVSFLEVSHSLIENNELKRIGLVPGYGYNGVNNGVGVCVLKEEIIYFISEQSFERIKKINGISKDDLAGIEKLKGLPYMHLTYFQDALMSELRNNEILVNNIVKIVTEELYNLNYRSTENVIRNNHVDSTGYAGIRMDGDHSLVEHNVVKNTILFNNDGGAIYSWGYNMDYTFNNTFRNNIVINAYGSDIATPENRKYGIGLYIDNRCHDILVEGNTCIGAVVGMLINDRTYNITLKNNTTYNNKYGLVLSIFAEPNSIKNVEIYDNVLCSSERGQKCLFLENRLTEELIPVKSDGNVFFSPFYTYPIVQLSFKDDARRFDEYTLNSWQQKSGNDLKSSGLVTYDYHIRLSDSFILVNESSKEKEFIINMGENLFDIHQNPVQNSIILPPLSSKIILVD